MRLGDTVPVIVSVPATVISVLTLKFCSWLTLAASVAAVPTPKFVILYVPSDILAVGVVCPSLVKAVESPVPRSAVSALNAVELMTVPLTTGCPALFMLNVPEPL